MQFPLKFVTQYSSITKCLNITAHQQSRKFSSSELKSLLGKNKNFLKDLIAPRVQFLTTRNFLGGPLLKDGLPWSTKKIIGLWLFGCAGMVYGAVAVGGLTRLTESGLSMVNWDLIKSMRPPVTSEEWEKEFRTYQEFPEYKYKSSQEEMTLEKFKFIWTMEYLHRMWGRAVGIVFLLPCAYFWYRGHFSGAMKKRMLIAGTLLISQGLIGWWMVKSGLDHSKNSNGEVPRVSQYRLVTHLSMAFVLYAIYIWTGLSHLLTPYDHTNLKGIKRLRGMVHGSKTAIFSTILMGAFVAGLDAGLVYNSWPKYADRWIPENLFLKAPAWKNFFENEVTVQFMHRNLAYITILSVAATWLFGRRLALNRRAKLALNCLFAMSIVQVVIGISTLVHHVPVWQASLHQNGALWMATFVLWLSHEIRKIPK